MSLFRTDLLIEIDFGNISVQKLWNEKTPSDCHHSQSDKNHDDDVNCDNSSDGHTQAGVKDCDRIQLDGRSEKYKRLDSTQSTGDTSTVDELDGRHQSGHRRRRCRLPTESSEDVSRSSSFSHQHQQQRQHYANDRFSHHHHHHHCHHDRDWVVVSPARRRHHEHVCGHHVDGYKSKKTCHCDKHSGHGNHSTSDIRSRHHCESHRSSSHHSTRHHQARYSHHH